MNPLARKIAEKYFGRQAVDEALAAADQAQWPAGRRPPRNGPCPKHPTTKFKKCACSRQRTFL